MSAVLSGQRESIDRSMYQNMDHSSFALTQNHWKLTFNADRKNGLYELYHLMDDPYERNNCLEQHPEMAEQMKLLLQKLRIDDDRYQRTF